MVKHDTCQINKGETIKNPDTLQPLPIPPIIWMDISMEFILGLPELGNKSIIMVFVDHLSKYTHLCALQHSITTSTVVHIFMANIFKLHGIPHSIVFECDPTFTSNFWQEIFKLHGTQLHLITTCHPAIEGKIEADNKCLEAYLRIFMSDKKNQWDKWLPLVE
jgi:hypothetical protein